MKDWIRPLVGMLLTGVAAAASPPLPVSASPAAGSGVSRTFAFTFSAAAGFQNLAVVDVLINGSLDGRRACYVAFVPSGASSGSVFLVDDAGDAGGPYQGMVLPGSGVVNNGQCSISGVGSAVSTSGNTLTLTLAIAFSQGFAGNQVLYLSAQDTSSNNSGWQALGTWNVPGATAPAGPSVSGMSPARSSSVSETSTLNFADSQSWQDISVVNVLVNSAIDGRHACYVAFVPSGASSGSVFLVDDAGDAGGPYQGMVLPGSGAVSNSQCSISGAGSAVTASGSTLTLKLAITLTPAFAGNQLFYLAARSATANSNWQAVGSDTVSFAAVISSNVPMTNQAGNVLAVALPVANIGAGDAGTVQVSAASLSAVAASSPALPLSLGAIKAGASATLNLNFASGSLTAGTNYALTVSGAFQSGAATLPFTINQVVTYGAPGIFLAPANPLSVTPALDQAHAATQSISAASGGVVTATGADGTVFTLSIPANALLSDESITITPVAAIAGLPVSGGLLAAVQLAPDGLQLQQPGTLTMQPKTNVPASQQVGFGYHGSGQEFYLQPLGGAAAGAISLTVLHFSGAGVGQGSPGNTGTPTNNLDRLQQQLQQNPQNPHLLAGLLQLFFDQQVAPQVQAAKTDDSQAQAALTAAFAWEREVVLLIGLDQEPFATNVAFINQAVPVILTNVYNKAYTRCLGDSAQSDRMVEGQKMISAERFLELIGGSAVPDTPTFVTQVSACLAGPLTLGMDSMTTMTEQFTDSYSVTVSSHVTAQSIPLPFDANSLEYAGSGTLAYPSCSVSMQWPPGYTDNGSTCTSNPGTASVTGVFDLNGPLFSSNPVINLSLDSGLSVTEAVTLRFCSQGKCFTSPLGGGFYQGALGLTSGFLGNYRVPVNSSQTFNRTGAFGVETATENTTITLSSASH